MAIDRVRPVFVTFKSLKQKHGRKLFSLDDKNSYLALLECTLF